MAEWSGTSRGNLLGYKIFAFSIRKIGLFFSYFLLFFVSTYFFLSSWKNNKSSYYYFRKTHRFSIIKSIFSIGKSYYLFGQTLIDRIMISSGRRDKFTYEFDGIENIKNTLKEGNGAVLVSAHIGNFEISEYFFEDIADDLIVNIVTTDFEKQQIKEYLHKLSIPSRMKYIVVEKDLSHIYQLNKAISNNEFICITGDRYMKGTKILQEDFMGQKASFPAGPFLIASRLRSPVLFVYVMKDSATHYHLYARRIEVDRRDAEELLKKYCDNLEAMVKKYPYQWFNYFDFWKQ